MEMAATTKVHLKNFLWGCVGGLIPQVMAGASKAVLDTSTPLPSNLGGGYILALLFFVALGGLWNVALKAHEIWLGLYHGASAVLASSFLLHVVTPNLPAHATPTPPPAISTDGGGPPPSSAHK